jgi:hypothetical protein
MFASLDGEGRLGVWAKVRLVGAQAVKLRVT